MIAWNKSLQFRVIQILFSLYIFEDRTKGKKKRKKRILLGEDKWQWLIPPCVRNKGID